MLSRIVGRLTTGKRFHIGSMFHDSAARHGATRVVLDQPLQLAPRDGTEHTVAGLAGKVDELVAGLAAAGVTPRQRVAIYKTNNFDIALLAAAVSRLGAVPAALAPPLPGEVIEKLLHRLDNPWLITDSENGDGGGGHGGTPFPLVSVQFSVPSDQLKTEN